MEDDKLQRSFKDALLGAWLGPNSPSMSVENGRHLAEKLSGVGDLQAEVGRRSLAAGQSSPPKSQIEIGRHLAGQPSGVGDRQAEPGRRPPVGSAPARAPRASRVTTKRPKLKSILVVPGPVTTTLRKPSVHSRLRFPAHGCPHPEGKAAEPRELEWQQAGSRRRRRRETMQTDCQPREKTQGTIQDRLSWPRIPVHHRLGSAALPPARASFLSLLKERTYGHCFRCLASDHKLQQCRDPIRCVRCLRSGHHTRHYRSTAPQSTSKLARIHLSPFHHPQSFHPRRIHLLPFHHPLNFHRPSPMEPFPRTRALGLLR